MSPVRSRREVGLFIAGTDTGVGKTQVTAGLLQAMTRGGRRVLGMKPVASGGELFEGSIINEDVALIASSSPIIAPIRSINPCCYLSAISPHIAAARAGDAIVIAPIVSAFAQLAGLADFVVVEGTGGWLTPINHEQTMADVAIQLALPVILVVGLRLGCLNHALLSAAAIGHSGCRLAGWIGNAIDPDFAEPAANVATLTARLGTPPLALLPYLPKGPPGPSLASPGTSPQKSSQESSFADLLRPLALFGC